MEKLEIRIAQPISGRGIYHEKLGLFTDEAGAFVVFAGSANESRTAYECNYECIDVFTSWQEPRRAVAKKKYFEQLWSGRAPGTLIYEFPEAARRELIRVVKHQLTTTGSSVPLVQQGSLWPHQLQAIDAFLATRRGILEMATGSGKTRVALEILTRLINESGITTVIIDARGTDLLDQWSGQLAGALGGLKSNFRLLRHYEQHHDRDEYILDPTGSVLLCSRGILASVMRNLNKHAQKQMIIIHDEVHGFGSPSMVSELDGTFDDVPYRLGLSATPEREYDATGNDFIERNVGPVLFRFDLADAIRAKILCGFDYYPLFWSVGPEDRAKIQSVYKRKAAREAEGRPMSDEEMWIELARVYKTSETKLPIFRSFITAHPDLLERCIVFVAEKSYGEKVFEDIHAVTHEFHTYFDSDDKKVLRRFASGEIACLITCHRISEGIDIRSVKSIVLLSSDRARLETIQRIGRCLRIDPNNPSKRAAIVDFIRAKDSSIDPDTPDELRTKWLSQLSQINP
jgi:superfamily II DNA or RNA helicase